VQNFLNITHLVTTIPEDKPSEEELFGIVPRKRTTTFDVRRAIRLMADRESFFEIGPLWGTDQVAGFGSSVKRTLGRSVMAKQLTEIFQRSRASFEQPEMSPAPVSMDPGLLR